MFAREPGSAEMPSAGRPFTPALVAELVSRGILIAPVTLHTGVSSPEVGEPPFPERYDVPESTARLVNAVHTWGARVIAVGTTVVRALETVAGPDGTVAAGRGSTGHLVTPASGVRAVDGLLTGWHEPRSSHLQLLEAVAGRDLVERSYREAAETRLPPSRVRRPAPDPRRAAGQRRRGSSGERAMTPPSLGPIGVGAVSRRRASPPVLGQVWTTPPAGCARVEAAGGVVVVAFPVVVAAAGTSTSALSFKGRPRSSVATTFTTAGPAAVAAGTTRPNVRAPAGTHSSRMVESVFEPRTRVIRPVSAVLKASSTPTARGVCPDVNLILPIAPTRGPRTGAHFTREPTQPAAIAFRTIP